MAASDAVYSTAVARREVRNALNRLEYHIGRGTRGTLGVNREIRFLDALHRQAVRVSGQAVGRPYTASAVRPFGEKAYSALLTGNSATIGRMKSSLLADFSADSLQPVRDSMRERDWVWQANASACPTCLDQHGGVHPPNELFFPMHPSCLCIPAPADGSLSRLTDDQLIDTVRQFGLPRYQGLIDDFASGKVSRATVARREAVNLRSAGREAVERHLAKREVRQVGLTAPAPPVPQGPGPLQPLTLTDEQLVQAAKADLRRADNGPLYEAYEKKAIEIAKENIEKNPLQDDLFTKPSKDISVALKEELNEKLAKSLLSKFDDELIGRVSDEVYGPSARVYGRYSGKDKATRNFADSAVSQWAGTSGDNNGKSLLFQRAVAEEFGLPWPPLGYNMELAESGMKWVDNIVNLKRGPSSVASGEEIMAVMRGLVRSMYDETQAYLAEAFPGQTSIRLYRGMGGIEGTPYTGGIQAHEIVMNPASSYSLSPHIANGFTYSGAGTNTQSMFIAVDVPFSRIMANPFTGVGCYNEAEFVVIGAKAAETASFVPLSYGSGTLSEAGTWGQSTWRWEFSVIRDSTSEVNRLASHILKSGDAYYN